MEDPDGAESTLEWQCAKSGRPKSAPGEHGELTFPEQSYSESWLVFAMCGIVSSTGALSWSYGL